MNLEAFKALATSKAARGLLQTQKHSPKILFVAGAVGVVGGTVLACRATLKVSDILDEHEKVVANVQHGIDTSDNATQEDRDKIVRRLRIEAAGKIVKLYAPATGLVAVSVLALTGSHVILTKRNGALMAAYAGLDRAYKEYRQRVASEFGVDTDRKFAMGGETVAVEEKLANGKTKLTKKVVLGKNEFGHSPYAVLFDEQSQWWTREPGMNANVIMMRQSWANDKLKAKGHLFLNEVLDFLDLPRTQAGAIVGWIYDRDNPEHVGDNYVTFGVFENDEDTAEGFIDGSEKTVWLDFNVDGVIYDKI